MAECNEVNELPDENIVYDDELVNTEEVQQDELFDPVEEILPEEPIEEEIQHDHAPVKSKKNPRVIMMKVVKKIIMN